MGAVFFIGLINIFFVPMLPLFLYYRKSSRPLKPCLELLFQYVTATDLIIPIAKILSFLPAKQLHFPFPVEPITTASPALIQALFENV